MYLTTTGTHVGHGAFLSGVLLLAKGELSKRSHQSSIYLNIKFTCEKHRKDLGDSRLSKPLSLMNSGIVTHLWLCK